MNITFEPTIKQDQACEYLNDDITLSDYWGSQRVEKEIDDDKGLSLININSGKGVELFEQIKILPFEL